VPGCRPFSIGGFPWRITFYSDNEGSVQFIAYLLSYFYCLIPFVVGVVPIYNRKVARESGTGSVRNIAVLGNIVFVSNHLVGYDTQTGEKLWSAPSKQVSGIAVSSTGDSEILVCAGSSTGALALFAPASHTQRWILASAMNPAETPVMSVDGRAIFVRRGLAIRAVNAATGDLLWETVPLGIFTDLTPIPDPVGRFLYVGTDGRQLGAVDTATGELRFSLGSLPDPYVGVSSDGAVVFMPCRTHG
jgi:outer membrane protein assembly factor BamB